MKTRCLETHLHLCCICLWVHRSPCGQFLIFSFFFPGLSAGYVRPLRIYMGQDKRKILSSSKAVINLLGAVDLYRKGYEVHTNDWYTSPCLFHYLQGCAFSGTTRSPSRCCWWSTITRWSQSQTDMVDRGSNLVWWSTTMSGWREWTWVTSWLSLTQPLASPANGPPQRSFTNWWSPHMPNARVLVRTWAAKGPDPRG